MWVASNISGRKLLDSHFCQHHQRLRNFISAPCNPDLMPKNFYEILDISRTLSGTPVNSATLKHAYKKALLQYHPDKVTTLASKKDVPTIDDITLAYQTLSDAKARSEYDRELQKAGTMHDRTGNRGVGLEVKDLDDMFYDRTRALWTCGCRCGASQGFTLTEDDLWKAVEETGGGNSHEILVGCSGCSLSLKVKFGVTEED